MLAGGELGAHGPTVDLTVVGVVRQPIDLAASPENQDVEYLGGNEIVYLTPAFSRAYIEPVLGPDYLRDGGVNVRLVHGAADVDRFRADFQRLVSSKDAHAVAQFQTSAELASAGRRALRTEANAMWLFAVAAALMLLLLGGQALARDNSTDTDDALTLRGLGMTRRQILSVSLARTASIALLVA